MSNKGGSEFLGGPHVAGDDQSNTGSSNSTSANDAGSSAVGGSSSYAPSEMSCDNQFQFNTATLEALLSGSDNTNWMGMHATAASFDPSVFLLRGNATTNNQANALPVDVTSTTLPPGLSFPQFGGLQQMDVASSGGVAVPNMPLHQHHQRNPFVTFAPIQSASSELSSDDWKKKPSSSKRKRGSVSSAAVSEDEQQLQGGGTTIRRKQDRNHREQQRSQQISQQIDYLREMLAASNVQSKPDKYSTLATVTDFIKNLQEKVQVLDTEHKGLLETIVQTTNMVNGQNMTTVPADMKVTDVFDEGKMSPFGGDEVDAPMFVSGLDYKAVFEACPVANAITSIDGRFLDCNTEFEEFSGFSKSELIVSTTNSNSTIKEEPSLAEQGKKPARSMSLFNVVKREQMEEIFVAMSDMLKLPFPLSNSSQRNVVEYQELDQWSGVVSLVRREGAKMKLCVCLIRGNQSRPKFFSCSLLPAVDDTSVITSAAVG